MIIDKDQKLGKRIIDMITEKDKSLGKMIIDMTAQKEKRYNKCKNSMNNLFITYIIQIQELKVTIYQILTNIEKIHNFMDRKNEDFKIYYVESPKQKISIIIQTYNFMDILSNVEIL